MNNIVICAGLVLVGSMALLAQSHSPHNEPVVSSIPNFVKLSAVEADAAAVSVIGRHDAVVAELLAQFNAKDTGAEAKTYLAYVLGELRARRAVTSLVEQIALQAPKVDPSVALPRWGKHPAVDALVRIGEPAIHEVLAKLRNEEAGERRTLMCDVLLRALAEKEVVRIRLEREISREADKTKQARLEAALKSLSLVAENGAIKGDTGQ